MIESTVYNQLKNNVTLAENRVYGLLAPQGAGKPYITYSKVSNHRGYTHEGRDKTSRPRFQVSCYAEAYHEVKQVAEQVVSAMESIGGEVDAPFLAGEQDLYEQETGLYHVSVDFFLHTKEE